MNSRLTTQVLRSQLDHSTNFVAGNLEARYVHRPDTDYFITYLSSHQGCDLACRFCHLTQTGQTDTTPATITDYQRQIDTVLNHYLTLVGNGEQEALRKIHYNWMARGEALLNPSVQWEWGSISWLCQKAADEAGIPEVALNVSTIIPNLVNPFAGFLRKDVASQGLPKIFYSLYSVDPEFRRRWLPKAMEPERALKYLVDYQKQAEDRQSAAAEVVLHWAFIEGKNDSEADVAKIIDLVDASGLKARFNLVRYNPYSEAQGRESEESVLVERFSELEAAMKLPGSRIVPRVGFDVYASCGTFVNLAK